jgi:hypothetical protein
MKKACILRILLLVTVYGFSQGDSINTGLTEKQNEEWINGFQKLTTKSAQLEFIKEKITRDSVCHLSNVNTHHWKFAKVERKSFGSGRTVRESNCDCKIQFLLSLKSVKNSIPLDYSEFEHTGIILSLINDSNISKISLFKEEMALALFGSRGKCGGIILYSENRKLRKLIRNELNRL